MSSSNITTTATMLRPRRPRSAMSSLSSHGSCHSSAATTTAALATTTTATTTTTRWSCPDVILLDDSQSCSYSDFDDEEYAISETKYSQHHVTEQREEKEIIIPLCRVFQNREKQTARRALLVRAVMTLITIAAIAINYISSASNPTTTKHAELLQNRIPITTNTNKSSIKVRKRRLVEIPIPKTVQSAVPTVTQTGSRLKAQRKNIAATVSIAQKATMHRDAMKRVTDQYGAGPHLVEFQIRIWPESDDGEHSPIISYFTVETAPVHMMPLSVHRFLQQITDELWDNTSFFMNVPHLIAAHPVSASGRTSKPRHLFAVPPSALTSSSSSSLLYTEYSSAYPHLKYTLGFVGNGPDFYINKRMNPQHTDPCFANVVIGRSIVDTLFRIRGHDRTPDRIRPIEIVTARIIERSKLHPMAMDEYLRTTIPTKM